MNDNYATIDCQYCGFLLRDATDGMSVINRGCCTECWTAFLEPLRLLHEDPTYLPSGIEINAWKNKLNKIHK